MEHALDVEFASIKARTEALVESIDEPLILSFELNKVQVDLLALRSKLLRAEKNQSLAAEKWTFFRRQLTHLTEQAHTASIQVRRALSDTKAETKTGENSDSESVATTHAAVLPQEREALFGNAAERAANETMSAQDKLKVDESTQEAFASEVLGMVRRIRSNAVNLSEKIASDLAVVDTTASVLDRSSRGLSSVGSRLMSYEATTALGWKFYIVSTLFIIVAIILGMTTIQVFPKW